MVNFDTVICPRHDSGGVLSFPVFIVLPMYVNSIGGTMGTRHILLMWMVEIYIVFFSYLLNINISRFHSDMSF